MTQSNMNDFFDQLPTPPREKMVRFAFYGGLGLLALGAGLKIMPHINNLLGMLVQGAFSALQLGALAVLIACGAFAVLQLWPVYKRLMESIARRTTVAIFGDDPITPLKMWLDEVRKDCQQIEASANDIGGIVTENQKTYDDNIALQQQADDEAKFALKKFGEDSSEFGEASVTAAGYLERANNARRINGPLVELHAMLIEIAKATRRGEREAEMAIGTAEQEWRAAIKADQGYTAATRALNRRSERYTNAKMAFDIIRQKYAGNFGRLRSLRQLSQQTITSMVLDQGVKQEQALERLRTESSKLLAYNPAPVVPSISEQQKTAVPALPGTEPSKLRLFDDSKS